MVSGCDHDWRWLPRPVFTLGMLGQRRGAHNVECTKCHARTWAHGTMPDARAILETETPTTERS